MLGLGRRCPLPLRLLCTRRGSSTSASGGAATVRVGGLGGIELPFRDTWFAFYQPERGGTAYLYEHSAPIDAVNFEAEVSPMLKSVRGLLPSECAITVTHGESYANCDVAHHPWYSYNLRLAGHKFGTPYCAYSADDIVSPNKVILPNQGRSISNARNLRNILEFLADPSPERVQRHLQRLLAAAVEDRWPRAHKAVFAVLAQSWGARVLGRDHITPRAVHQQYELLRERLKDLADGEQGGGGAEDRLLGGEEEAWEGAEGEDGEEEAEVAAEAAPVAVNRGPRRSRPPAEDGRHLL